MGIWFKPMEFVSDYKHIGMDQGGQREDHNIILLELEYD
jgi:hypothetical protein